MREQVQLLQLFLEIDEAIRRIDRRFLGINSADDLIRDDEGLDRIDDSSGTLPIHSFIE